jgi:sec-independent protein translocase protein TatC
MLGHLNELRTRLLWCVGVSILAITAALCYAEPLTRLFLAQAPRVAQFIQLTPGEAFMASVKLSTLLGLAVSLPVWLWHAVGFVLPGLLPTERKMLWWVVTGGLCLFVAGATFGLLGVSPLTVSWLLTFGDSLAVNQLSIGRYIDFVLMITVLVALSFELPVLLLALVMSGLLPKARVLQYWRQGTIAVFVASAILTPGQDPMSMLLVAGVLLLLYALSLLLIRFVL